MALYDQNIKIGSIVKVRVAYKLDIPYFENMEYKIISIFSKYGMMYADGVATDESKAAHPNVQMHITPSGSEYLRGIAQETEKYYSFKEKNLGFLTLVE